MNYQSFLIANFATGLDREVQPWLLPNDAFIELLDGYVYRGVINKRDGYSGYANGTKSIYTESRIVAAPNPTPYATGQVNNGAVLANINLPNIPVARGRVTVTDGVESHTDNGQGAFPTAAAGTINYTTGVITGFQFNAASAAAVTVTFLYYPGLPVMGIMNYIPTPTANNISVPQMIVADTRNVNRYNPATDRLDSLTTAITYTGTDKDFWSWVNYPSATFVPRLLFANGVVSATDVIQQYTGGNVTNYVPTFGGLSLNARQIFNVRDRLVLVQTIEAGVFYPRRIRISGTGANTDDFTNAAPGAGFIDVPDNTWLFGATYNRDDLIFFTESTTWLLKYTGNDVKPFILEKMDGSRGSAAAFSVISYLNRTLAASPRGLIVSDGYRVERIDDNIPDFSFNSIDNENFTACFSGFIDEDRDVYLIYPSQDTVKPTSVPVDSSDRILVINFEEDNFAIYRIPLSCMGNFIETIGVTWADLTAANGFPNWDALAAVYDTWASFPFSRGTPVAIGGGHKGEIWKLNSTEGEDNPQKIRAMTVVDSTTVRVTTDWNNYSLGDYISFEAVGGMTQINNKQAFIKAIVTPYNTFDVSIQTLGFSAYTSGGIASKVIQLECVGKKLNPWLEQDKKLRCGWMYFYVEVAETSLTDGFGDSVRAFLQVDVLTNNNEGTDWTNPTFTYQVDCTPINNEKGGKKWVKIWINQIGQFLQFRFSNNQAGAKVRVHATMLGFQPVGRLI